MTDPLKVDTKEAFRLCTCTFCQNLILLRMMKDCSLVVDAATPNIRVSALVADETEKQPFSPATKGVVDEMAIKVGLHQGTLPSSATAKRAIMFGESSEASEAVLVCEQLSSSAAENIVPRSGSESPIKKPKNAAADK